MARVARKKPAPQAPTDDAPVSSWREGLFRPIVLFWMAMACVAPLGYGTLTKLRSRVLENPHFQVDETSIVWNHLPTSLPAGWAEQTSAKILGENKLSIADPALPQTLGEKLAALPWVKSVRKVAIVYPKQIHVDVEVRQPVAMVQIKTGYYPIDEDGILLPPDDFSQADVEKFPVILNPETLPQGPAGIFWGDPAIRGAAQLAQLLTAADDRTDEATVWKQLGLQTIMLYRPHGAASGEVSYALVAQGGTHFLWGLAPGSETPKEPVAENKLKRLTHFVKDFGLPSTYPQALEVDLRGWQEITYQPLKLTKDKRLSGGHQPY